MGRGQCIEKRPLIYRRIEVLRSAILVAKCSLVRLHQYDDAKNVAAMIKRLEPQEVAAHTASCARALQVGEA